MPFQAFAAPSSRITKAKAKKPVTFKRTTSAPSPYADLPRRKAAARAKQEGKARKEEEEDDFFGHRLEDAGLVQSLATDLNLRHVPETIQYTRATMFSPIPEISAGMNSTRIAKVLNYRKNLPPIVSVAHIQALLNSPTTTEREIADLMQKGVVRKIVIPGRGTVGEVLILVRDLEEMIRTEKSMDESTKETFIQLLKDNPTAMTTIPQSKISPEIAKSVMHAGFLTSPTPAWTTTEAFARPGDGSKGTMTSISAISKAASGSIAAVGGHDVLNAAHGNKSSPGSSQSFTPQNYTVAIPSTGPYLKLISASRQHLVSLLQKSSKYKELPEDMLREKWDGNVFVEGGLGEKKRMRNEFSGVLAGKTRKWKSFWGLRFEWVLAECVGAGMVEVFETGSVGRGVRILS